MKNRVIFMVQMILDLVLLLALSMAGIVGISNRDARIRTTVTVLGYEKTIKVKTAEEAAIEKPDTKEAAESEDKIVEETDTDVEGAGIRGEGDAMVDAVKNRYPYAVFGRRFDDAIAAYSDVETELIMYPTQVLLVSMQEDEQKEERINRMMVERYLQCLPPITEEVW